MNQEIINKIADRIRMNKGLGEIPLIQALADLFESEDKNREMYPDDNCMWNFKTYYNFFPPCALYFSKIYHGITA